MSKETKITAEDLDVELDFEKSSPQQQPSSVVKATDLDIDVTYKQKHIAKEEQVITVENVDQLESKVDLQQSNETQLTETSMDIGNLSQDEFQDYLYNERVKKYEMKEKKWDERISPNFFGKSFFIRALIAFAIYSSIFFIGTTMEYFWTPYVFRPIFQIFFSDMFLSIAGTDEQLFMQLANIYFDNAIYFVLFVIIVPLFWKEIKASIKALWKKFWLIPLIPFVHFGMLWVSMFVTTLASIFFTLPDTSQNQEAIESSMEVSAMANVFPTVVGAPFVEEIIFRGIIAALVFFLTIKIIENLCKSSKTKYIIGSVLGIIVSAVFFGLIHVASRGDYLAIFPYLAMGLSFGTIYFVTGRNLMYTILLHMYHNAFSIIMFLIF